MKVFKKATHAAAGLMVCGAMALSLSSCLDDTENNYDDWRKQNDKFVSEINTSEYTRVVPDWAPGNSVYIKWHNDRSLTADSLVPMSTSTVDIKYELENIEGLKLGNSYAAATGDSVYQSMPNENIVGMWIAMTTMHVGDSATLIIPYPSAYGANVTSGIKPYSTLIYHMKLKAIRAYERPL